MSRLARHLEVTPIIPHIEKERKQLKKQNGTQREEKRTEQSECIPRTALTQTRNPNPGKAQSIESDQLEKNNRPEG